MEKIEDIHYKVTKRIVAAEKKLLGYLVVSDSGGKSVMTSREIRNIAANGIIDNVRYNPVIDNIEGIGYNLDSLSDIDVMDIYWGDWLTLVEGKTYHDFTGASKLDLSNVKSISDIEYWNSRLSIIGFGELQLIEHKANWFDRPLVTLKIIGEMPEHIIIPDIVEKIVVMGNNKYIKLSGGNGLKTCENMFRMNTLTRVVDVSELNLSNVISTRAMFYGMEKLEEVNLNGVNTENVIDMSSMFSLCKGITYIDLRSFKTSKLKHMNEMFLGCEYLYSLDLSTFDTGNVTDMGSVLADCAGLWYLDISKFILKDNKVDAGSFFYGCETLDIKNNVIWPKDVDTRNKMMEVYRKTKHYYFSR